MLELVKFDTLEERLILVVPGFVSLKMWMWAHSFCGTASRVPPRGMKQRLLHADPQESHHTQREATDGYHNTGMRPVDVDLLINPMARLKLSGCVLGIVSYSALNFVALSWLLNIAVSSPFVSRTLGVLIVAPVVWPLLLRAVLGRRFLRGRIVHPTPLA